MIVSSQVRDLVGHIEKVSSNDALSEALGPLLRELVAEVNSSTLEPEVQERYEHYQGLGTAIGTYPIDEDGFAKSFDPVENEHEFFDCWSKHGIVVGKAIASPELCRSAAKRLSDITESLSDGKCILSDPSTYDNIPLDPAGTPILSRGFFEIYHDKTVADIRQLVRLYLHHAIIWGQADLWTSFDRFGVKLPDHADSKGLPLHVDQNPLVHPDFRTIQGVLALADCPKERGSFVGVPGSRDLFSGYARMAERGEYVELKPNDPIAETLHANAQVLPLRAGDLVSWDSRTTHCNSANLSDQLRIVAYIAAGPVPKDEINAFMPRKEAFESGIGSNVRDSLMHASMKPRYTNPTEVARVREPEQLHLLGKLLYGQESYSNVK